MFVIILTLSDSLLAQVRSIAAELPHIKVNTNRVQELEFRPEVTETEALHWVETYTASGHYDKVELIRR